MYHKYNTKKYEMNTKTVQVHTVRKCKSRCSNTME